MLISGLQVDIAQRKIDRSEGRWAVGPANMYVSILSVYLYLYLYIIYIIRDNDDDDDEDDGDNDVNEASNVLYLKRRTTHITN